MSTADRATGDRPGTGASAFARLGRLTGLGDQVRAGRVGGGETEGLELRADGGQAVDVPLIGVQMVLIDLLLHVPIWQRMTFRTLATISTPASFLRRRRMMGPKSFQRRWTLQTSAVNFLKRLPLAFCPRLWPRLPW
jgi:hypothetical protein